MRTDKTDFNDQVINALDKFDEHRDEIRPGRWYSLFDSFLQAELDGKEVDPVLLDNEKKKQGSRIRRGCFWE